MKDFSEIYIEYYPRLLRFACDFVACKADAENLLHDAFLDLWKINDYIPSIKHINAYMFRLVRNRCIDYLKHQMCEKAYMEEAAVECRNKMITLEGMGDEQLIAKELATLIRETVDKLPPRCREIFLMSRIVFRAPRSFSLHYFIKVIHLPISPSFFIIRNEFFIKKGV